MNRRVREPAVKRIAAVVLAIVAVNVLIRLASGPDLELPSISTPDFPGWADAVWQVKNWVVLAAVALAVIGFVIGQFAGGDDN